jgi:hypothetical protein
MRDALLAAITGFDIFTLVVAAVGAVTGIAALIVEALLFQRSGPRVSVEMRQAWAGQGGAITVSLEEGIRRTPPAGYVGFYWAIKVTNSGRAATTVERVIVDVDKAEFFEPVPPFGPGYPARLEAESSETWYGEMHNALATVEATVATLGGERRMRAVAQLGSGRRVFGRWIAIREGPATPVAHF